MPRTRSLAWSELKIGVMAVAALGLTALLVIAVGGASGFAWQRYELKTNFANVQGLKAGAIVRIAESGDRRNREGESEREHESGSMRTHEGLRRSRACPRDPRRGCRR